MSQLQDFVDREEELEVFLQMLSAERRERVLDICARNGTGKSYLLRRMRHECGERGVPCSLAEFAATWQPDPPKLMRALAERLGLAHFPSFCQQEARGPTTPISGEDAASLQRRLEIHRRNMANLEMQCAQYGMEAPLHIIRGIEHEQAEIAKVQAQLQMAQEDQVEGREQLLRALSRAFRDDLLTLAAERPVVLLLDGYEHTPAETAGWIQEWLLQKSIREQETRLIVVLAGPPAGARPSFEPWGMWWRMVVRRERLSSLRYEHVQKYLCDICKLALEEAHLRAYHAVVQDDPLMMAQIAANLGEHR